MAKKAFNEQNNGKLGQTPPKSLDKTGAAMWRKVVPVLNAAAAFKRIDANLVEVYCSQWSIYRQALKNITKNGIQTPIYKTVQNSAGEKIGTDFVGYKRNPATSVYNDAIKTLGTVGSELGLSPKSRAKIMELASDDDDSGVDLKTEMQKFM